MEKERASLSSASSNSKQSPREKKKIGHRRVTQEGTVTYKKKSTREIMSALQLGIQHHISTVRKIEDRPVLFSDFPTIETVHFPSAGSRSTPAHPYPNFHFQTFAPFAFRELRRGYQLDITDFLQSICINPLRDLSNPGASGSIFYITEDDEFIIKTMDHSEGDFLQSILPAYHSNLLQRPRTLLPKFYGYYCYQTARKNIRFVVMTNLLPSTHTFHEKYDLKGSLYKRHASKTELAKSSPTLKDLDFRKRHHRGISLEKDTYNALIKTIDYDCHVLESLNIMDYSLLLGIHNIDQELREKETKTISTDPPANVPNDNSQTSNGNGRVNSSQPLKEENNPSNSAECLEKKQSQFKEAVVKVQKHLAAYSTAMESITDSSEQFTCYNTSGGIPARNATGDRLLLFIGIIDILQSYRLTKRLEHHLKSISTKGDKISVNHPSFYAKRFLENARDVVFHPIQSLDQPTILGPNSVLFGELVGNAIAPTRGYSSQSVATNPTAQFRLSSFPPVFPRTNYGSNLTTDSGRSTLSPSDGTSLTPIHFGKGRINSIQSCDSYSSTMSSGISKCSCGSSLNRINKNNDSLKKSQSSSRLTKHSSYSHLMDALINDISRASSLVSLTSSSSSSDTDGVVGPQFGRTLDSSLEKLDDSDEDASKNNISSPPVGNKPSGLVENPDPSCQKTENGAYASSSITEPTSVIVNKDDQKLSNANECIPSINTNIPFISEAVDSLTRAYQRAEKEVCASSSITEPTLVSVDQREQIPSYSNECFLSDASKPPVISETVESSTPTYQEVEKNVYTQSLITKPTAFVVNQNEKIPSDSTKHLSPDISKVEKKPVVQYSVKDFMQGSETQQSCNILAQAQQNFKSWFSGSLDNVKVSSANYSEDAVHRSNTPSPIHTTSH